MTQNEKILAVNFLNLASEEFSNHGCNDVDEKYFKNWSIKERQQFVKEYYDWNGDPENYDPEFLHLPDFCIFSFLAHKILNNK